MGVIRSAGAGYYDADGINNDNKYGDYRYIPLNEIIDSFNAAYVGEGKICEKVTLNDVNFHAIRALQELSYDTLKCTKSWEITVQSTLVAVMPIDYINYVKLSWSDGNGIQRIIYPASKTSNARVATTANELPSGGHTTSGDDIVEVDPDSDGNQISATLAKFNQQADTDIGSTDADELNDEYGRLIGGRYGIDPQYAQANGSFYIDHDKGKFHFSSNLSGKTVIIEYISDGIANTSGNAGIDLTNSMVPKLAEEAIYKHILYGVLSARKDTPGGLLGQLKRERFAETRKAKLRLSNIKLEELTQILRGSSKHIKH